MKSLRRASIAAIVLGGAAVSGDVWALPVPGSVVSVPARKGIVQQHTRPRLKLAVERFSINSFDGTPIQMTGGRLDAYPFSERWVRAGFHTGGGGGTATVINNAVSVNYGQLGLSAGFQYPARVTPFVEGHVAGGFLTGRLNGTVAVPGGTLSNTSGTTWLYGRGVGAGAEFYTVGRLYVSASLGWIRTSWASPDYASMLQDPNASTKVTEITTDSLIWKLGIGI